MLLDPEATRRVLKNKLNAETTRAAKPPIIQKALVDDVEQQMWRALAAALITQIDSAYSAIRHGSDLMIFVALPDQAGRI